MNENITHDGDNVAAAQYIAGKHFGYIYYEFVEKLEKFELSLSNADGEQYTVMIARRVSGQAKHGGMAAAHGGLCRS